MPTATGEASNTSSLLEILDSITRLGELRFADHLLQGDIDGNGRVDFEVYINADQIFIDDLVLR